MTISDFSLINVVLRRFYLIVKLLSGSLAIRAYLRSLTVANNALVAVACGNSRKSRAVTAAAGLVASAAANIAGMTLAGVVAFGSTYITV